MQIDWPVVRQQAIQRGVIMTRVAVRDFDHNDQVDNSLVDFETYIYINLQTSIFLCSSM